MIWVVVAALLAVAATVLQHRATSDGAKTATTARLLEGDLNGVVRLTVQRGTDEIFIERSDGARGGDDVWTIRQSGGPSWPVEPGRVRALLRILSEMTGAVEASSAVPDDQDMARLALWGADAGQPLAELRLRSQRLAGLGVVHVTEGDQARSLRVSDALHRAFDGEGAMAWRDRRALPGLPADIARLTVRTPDVTIELARVEGRWSLRAPVSAAADPGTIDSVVRSLQSIESERFVGAEAEDFPDSVRIAIGAEADRRDPAGEGRTVVRWTLELGGVAPGGGAFLARVAGDRVDTRSGVNVTTHGPQIVELRAERLAGVPGSPEAYISRTLVSAPPTDIGALRLSSGAGGFVEYRRTASNAGWAVHGGDGALTPTTTEDRERLDQLVAVLAASRCEQITILPADDSLPGGMDVTLGGLSGAEIERCRLFIDQAEGRATIVAVTGRVSRAWVVTPELSAWIASR